MPVKKKSPGTFITYAHTETLSAVLYVRVAPAESEKVRTVAAREGLTAAALVRKVMVEWLAKHA